MSSQIEMIRIGTAINIPKLPSPGSPSSSSSCIGEWGRRLDASTKVVCVVSSNISHAFLVKWVLQWAHSECFSRVPHADGHVIRCRHKTMCTMLGRGWEKERNVSVCVCVRLGMTCVRTCTDVTALLCPRRNLTQVPVETSHSYKQPSLHKEETTACEHRLCTTCSPPHPSTGTHTNTHTHSTAGTLPQP